MSIATAIQNAQGKVADAYTAVSNKGGTLPATQNLSNLPTAISSIPAGGGPALYREFQVDNTGKLIPNTTTTHIMDFTGVMDVSDYALYRAYYNNAAISGTVNMSGLTTISGNNACGYMFFNCTGLTSVDLSALTTISGIGACGSMFSGCTGLTTANLSGLTTISGSSACNSMFSGCTGLIVVYIGGTAAINFGTYTNQFQNMFQGCTQSILVYAPAASQAQIEALYGYPNFGATGAISWYWRS